ncbi:MAG TPA: hypothetical protein VJZ78_03050 [Anaerolineales bacterium]|nr:hypothetical protein [Anaerolineales bacterium]
MAFRNWEVIQTCFCAHVDQEVNLESELVFPAEFLPDQNPRILGHRCSKGLMCNQFSQSACVWAGTNPSYDPFQD